MHVACSNLLSCLTTLESLSSLVQSVPRMIVMDEIGRKVELSIEAASLAQRNASLGISDSSAVRALAEDAFFIHPLCLSVMLQQSTILRFTCPSLHRFLCMCCWR